MSWRIVVISKRAKLDYQLGYMVVRNEEVTKIHLGEISTVLIESTAVSITTSLLAELTKKKIKVIFCDEKRNPSSELIGYYGSHDTSNKVRKQVLWSRNIKDAVWTEIVTEKIRKQKELLEYLGKEESGVLQGYLNEICWNDETNREGHAAKVYFALNGRAVKGIVDSVHKNSPPEGLVQLLSVTEKQYSKMDLIVGETKSEVLDSDERLVIL